MSHALQQRKFELTRGAINQLPGWKLLTVCLSRTGKNSGGQVNVLGTIPEERLKYSLFPLVPGN